jgi:DNA-binding NarL/FixJ family response regulator
MADARILIVDDHPLFREALRNALGAAKSQLDISEAGSLDTLIAHLAKDDACDLVLLDLRMPGVQGLSGLIYLRSQYPNIPVVVISASEETGIVQKSLDLGASGFIPKSSGTTTIIEASKRFLPAASGRRRGPTGSCPPIRKRRISRGAWHPSRRSKSAC